VLFVSCASNSLKSELGSLSKRPDYHQKLIPVSSRDEAFKVIGNKTNFIKMIFEQTVDPYFGTPRWSEYCLGINQIGNVIESNNGIQSTSLLYLNKEGEPGFCNDRPELLHSYVIFLYCEGMKDVLEMRFIKRPEENFPLNSLCD
jgi:hypothetical protein